MDKEVKDLSKISFGRAHESFWFTTDSGWYILKAWMKSRGKKWQTYLEAT